MLNLTINLTYENYNAFHLYGVICMSYYCRGIDKIQNFC